MNFCKRKTNQWWNLFSWVLPKIFQSRYSAARNNIDYKNHLLEVAVICDAIATPFKVIKKGRFISKDKVEFYDVNEKKINMVKSVVNSNKYKISHINVTAGGRKIIQRNSDVWHYTRP